MKIKTVKKMTLPELIQYVWDEQIKSTYNTTQYHSNFNTIVEVDMSGQVSVLGKHYGNEVYTVPVMEDLTEETEFKQIIALYQDCGMPRSFGLSGVSIREIKASMNIRCVEPLKLFIYTDELIEIWSHDSGIPEEGVLEVDVR